MIDEQISLLGLSNYRSRAESGCQFLFGEPDFIVHTLVDQHSLDKKGMFPTYAIHEDNVAVSFHDFAMLHEECNLLHASAPSSAVPMRISEMQSFDEFGMWTGDEVDYIQQHTDTANMRKFGRLGLFTGKSMEELRWEAYCIRGSQVLADAAHVTEASQSVETDKDGLYLISYRNGLSSQGLRITLHQVDGCRRSRDPFNEFQRWEYLSDPTDQDFNWRCKFCFPGLRANAKVKTRYTLGLGEIKADSIDALADKSPASESESSSDSGSTASQAKAEVEVSSKRLCQEPRSPDIFDGFGEDEPAGPLGAERCA